MICTRLAGIVAPHTYTPAVTACKPQALGTNSHSEPVTRILHDMGVWHAISSEVEPPKLVSASPVSITPTTFQVRPDCSRGPIFVLSCTTTTRKKNVVLCAPAFLGEGQYIFVAFLSGFLLAHIDIQGWITRPQAASGFAIGGEET